MRALTFALLILTSVGAHAAGVFERALTEIEPGLWLSARPDDLRQPVEGNIIFIEASAGIIAIDSGGTPLSAEIALDQLSDVTPLPVVLLINTHWHGDHTLGNQVFASRFPGLEILGTTATHDAMTGSPMDYVDQYTSELLPGYAAYLRDTLESGVRSDGSELDDAARERITQQIEDVVAYQTELERVTIMPPTRLFDGTSSIVVGDTEVVIEVVGHAHADGDIAVWLPGRGVLVAGDVLGAPIPFGTASAPRAWAAAIDDMLAHEPRLILAGHGAPQRNTAYATSLRTLLLAIADAADQAAASGVSLDSFSETLDVSAEAAPFMGDDQQVFMFTETFLRPIARSAWLEAMGEPIVQGALSRD